MKIRKYTQQFPSADVFIGKQSLPYMKKIIVATDYSAEAENAADFAAAVAAEQGHELVRFKRPGFGQSH